MDKLYELRDTLCEALKSYAGREVSASTITMADTLAHAIKNIDKIILMSEKEASYLRGTDDDYWAERRVKRHTSKANDLNEMVKNIPDQTTRSIVEAIIEKIEK